MFVSFVLQRLSHKIVGKTLDAALKEFVARETLFELIMIGTMEVGSVALGVHGLIALGTAWAIAVVSEVCLLHLLAGNELQITPPAGHESVVFARVGNVGLVLV